MALIAGPRRERDDDRRGGERPPRAAAPERLLAWIARDAELVGFLETQFLAPLGDPAGATLRLPRTLRAYLDLLGDLSAAAAAIGVSRQTLASRIALVEERIGKPIPECLAEVDLALRLSEYPPALGGGQGESLGSPPSQVLPIAVR